MSFQLCPLCEVWIVSTETALPSCVAEQCTMVSVIFRPAFGCRERRARNDQRKWVVIGSQRLRRPLALRS